MYVYLCQVVCFASVLRIEGCHNIIIFLLFLDYVELLLNLDAAEFGVASGSSNAACLDRSRISLLVL